MQENKPRVSPFVNRNSHRGQQVIRAGSPVLGYAGRMPSPAGSASRPEHVLPVRAVRPRNRRQLIARAAALAFSERGYHGVSMEAIASEVGISAAALYRHYPGKYSLFLEAALRLVQDLLDATDDAVLPAAETPGERLEQLVAAVIAVTQANRRTGSIYRHEAHYLSPADHTLLWTRFDQLTRRVLLPLSAVQPRLDPPRARLLCVGAFGMIASITAHHTVLSPRKTAELLRESVLAVLHFPLDAAAGPAAGGSSPGPAVPAADRPRSDAPDPATAPALPDPATAPPPSDPDTPVPAAPGTVPRRELLLSEAVTLFYRKGYREVGIEEIGAAAGVTASAVYRHFPGKSALLLQACQRAAERLAAATEAAVAPAAGPAQALVALTSAYVRHTFAHHQLMSVYFADSLNLSADEQAQLRSLQRAHIRVWVDLLAELRPELGAAEIRFLVHGALNMAADLGRFTRFDRSPENCERISRLILQALGVGG